LIGRGGMGVVYEAYDSDIRRSVAIKVMNAAVSAHPGARERFMREAQLAAAVENDHVVPVFFVGGQFGAPYIVMPLLRGESLEERLKRGRLEPAEVIRVGREIAVGLTAAHDRGILHRDLKPGNVWLDADTGRARILDFGLARPNGAVSQTGSGGMAGSPPYMAPEQIDGPNIDERADLFALGALLYECATGKRAFQGPTIAATLKAVADHHPAPPEEINPAVPTALSGLVLRLLAKKAADRPVTARSVTAELAAISGLIDRAPPAEPIGPPCSRTGGNGCSPRVSGRSSRWRAEGRCGWRHDRERRHRRTARRVSPPPRRRGRRSRLRPRSSRSG
jgi:serine/threonine protein kinase